MKNSLFLVLFFSSLFIYAQENPKATSSSERISSVLAFEAADKNGLLDSIPFENIGPTVFSGRVVDLEVDPQDPNHFYVAYASGGLWETLNNGTSFIPIFDNESVLTIGDIAVDWKNKTIWVGTGEVNSSRSSYAGVGIFKSTNNGKTWTNKGLTDSHHIGRIVLNPIDPRQIYVAVLGHLYSSNDERGVFSSQDGGETWQKSLFIDNKTGVVDLIMDPSNPNTLYAAAWERDRKAWDFIESGPGSAIYKTSNSGKNWSKLTGGFPSGDGVGRIGLSHSADKNGVRIYALLDNYHRRPETEPKEGLSKELFTSMSRDSFLLLEDESLDEFLKSNGFGDKYTAKSVKKDVKSGKFMVKDLSDYLSDANSLLFDTPVIGAELYSSNDGGKSWQKTHKGYLDGVYFSYGYYFGVITANPSNKNQVYIAGVPILRSDDGGKKFKSVNGDNVHVDHHIIWINPKNPKHIILGNDGGVNISYDSGENWVKCNSPSVGQFYYIAVDNDKPYNVYGGVQDNGVWKGSNNYRAGTRWHNTGQYPYEGLLGGDGMQVQIDTRDNATVYTGLQFGNYFRLNTKTDQRKRITPKHELGEKPYRWNWQTPILLSTHQQDVLYMGANKLFRSFNQGNDFEAISGDLTTGGKKGDVPYGTLSTIHESPLSFGLLYTGSDDGLVHYSPDGGYSWMLISKSLPQNMWVSRVQASAHAKSRVYVSLNGYRWDDFKPYVYMSDDYGKTWTSIASNLPDEPINVIKEDPTNENIIYVGTDRATYISIDMGKSYSRFKKGLPNVPIHDLVIHSDSKNILLGTHGRSIYKADLKLVYELIEHQNDGIYALPMEKIRYRSNLGQISSAYSEPSSNKQEWHVYAKNSSSFTMEIVSKDSLVLNRSNLQLNKGLNTISYDLSIDEKQIEDYKKAMGSEAKKLKIADDKRYYLLPGNYTLKISNTENKTERKFEIVK